MRRGTSVPADVAVGQSARLNRSTPGIGHNAGPPFDGAAPGLPTNTHAPWRELPFQTVGNTAAITGRSPAHVYTLLNAGDLDAVKLGGKTLIPTQSILAYLARAKPWRADARRVAAANEKRIEAGET